MKIIDCCQKIKSKVQKSKQKQMYQRKIKNFFVWFRFNWSVSTKRGKSGGVFKTREEIITKNSKKFKVHELWANCIRSYSKTWEEHKGFPFFLNRNYRISEYCCEHEDTEQYGEERNFYIRKLHNQLSNPSLVILLYYRHVRND